MKKLLGIVVLGLLLSTNAFAGSKWGKGELKLSNEVINAFIKYIKGPIDEAPYLFAVSKDGLGYNYYFCAYGLNNCSGGDEHILEECQKYSNDVECSLFARGRTIKWKNGINPAKGKKSKIKSKWSGSEIRTKLTELGFYGNTTTTEKIEKKKEKKNKVVKTYSLEGKRSIALSWEGYSDLIAGTVEFDESDYKGTLNLSLPNNDGACEGSYSLQLNGKGTWQISCTNNMGAAGTLKWTKDGSVTGNGRDYKDKKVKFTVSKKS